MRRSSYGKCLYFFFLIVSICTGFPIDEAMNVNVDDTGFRNTVVSTRSKQWFRRPWAQTRALRPNTGRIEAQVIEESSSELFPRIPSTPSFPVRRQRSSSPRPQNCFKEHFSSKAYKAEIVLRVLAQGFQQNSTGKKKPRNYKVQFKVVDRYKNSTYPVNNQFISIKFANTTGNCVKDSRRRRNLVKADIQMYHEYILFLNVSNDKLIPVSPPEPLLKNRHDTGMLNILKKVCRTNFKTRNISIVKLDDKFRKHNITSRERRKKLKLVCKVKGLPILQISWKLNNVSISNNTYTRIRYSKTSSILLVKHPKDHDFGRYECIAQSINGTTVSKSIEVQEYTDARPIRCDKKPRESFCLNEGQCYMDLQPHMYYCICINGFSGERCENKDVVNPSASMYHQTPSYTCKLGLSTKYYC